MANPILILAEQLRGEIAEITYELLALGRTLADETGAPLEALLLGSDVGSAARSLGKADLVHVRENPAWTVAFPEEAAACLAELVDATGASLVLVGGTNSSMCVGPYLSQHTGLPFVNFAKDVRVEDGALAVVSQLYGGKIHSEVRLGEMRGIISLSPGSVAPEGGHSDQEAKIDLKAVERGPGAVEFDRFIETEAGDVDITKQDVLVGVGRGVQSEDGIQDVEELAKLLGGEVCASRPVIDQGWLPLSRQVGKSGMNVKPRLYLALGISGAPEHWEGMQGSQMVVAVNTDPGAPIFEFAQYGTTIDLFDFVDALREAIENRNTG